MDAMTAASTMIQYLRRAETNAKVNTKTLDAAVSEIVEAAPLSGTQARLWRQAYRAAMGKAPGRGTIAALIEAMPLDVNIELTSLVHRSALLAAL